MHGGGGGVDGRKIRPKLSRSLGGARSFRFFLDFFFLRSGPGLGFLIGLSLNRYAKVGPIVRNDPTQLIK
jgi:hypothetical protein